MRIRLLLSALALSSIASCSAMGSNHAVVKGAGPDDLLKLRAGPGLGFNIIMGLPDGTRLTKQKCVTESGQLWCRVSLADNPGVSGYVSADYLGMGM
ncbi:SH3 domain-containing protein [Thioclava sp. GXIMD2076]|uniref:SH3 domain-containing protein n=1 Tax=Thioclava kandeliae TaxID=3070818 RepID=A0ABV1SBQ5_9RHOB